MDRKNDQSVIKHCIDLYDRTYALWRSLEGQYPTWACRYSILYGPPIVTPELMIVGSNPGFNANDLYDEEVQTWPVNNEYLVKDWPLAVRLRSLFDTAGLGNVLACSVGTNRLFFKSKSLGSHESGLGWRDNPAPIRQELEAYCSKGYERLVTALQPKRILTLGLGVFDNVADATQNQVTGHGGRRIAVSGTSNGVPVMGIIHPTGARVSSKEWQRLAGWLGREFDGRIGSSDDPATMESDTDFGIDVRSRASVTRAHRNGRQARFRPDTVVKAGSKPRSSYAYQPIHDFWRELASKGEISVQDFHQHMLSIGWRRPQGKLLTYDITRTDIACMCREGFAVRVRR